jgi:hypothetical protein
MAKLNAGIATLGRSPRPRPSMTPSQIQAYLLARETLRRLGRAASAPMPPSTQAQK